MSGQKNVPLTLTGRLQSRHLSKLIPHDIDVVFTSTMRRAAETLSGLVPLNTRKDLSVYLDSRLSEKKWGDIEGRCIENAFSLTRKYPDFAPIGGESYRQVAFRVFNSSVDMVNYCKKNGKKNCLVITHAGPMRILLAAARRIEPYSEIFEQDVANCKLYEIDSHSLRLSGYWWR